MILENISRLSFTELALMAQLLEGLAQKKEGIGKWI